MAKTPRFNVKNSGALERAENAAADTTLVKMTLRFPPDLHRWLSIKALDDRSSIQEITVTALNKLRHGR